MEAFFKKEARYDLERLSAIYAGRIGKPVKSDVSMKDTRSRWGFLFLGRNLSFSWASSWRHLSSLIIWRRTKWRI